MTIKYYQIFVMVLVLLCESCKGQGDRSNKNSKQQENIIQAKETLPASKPPQPNIVPTNPNPHPSTAQQSNVRPTHSSTQPSTIQKPSAGQPQLNISPTPNTQPSITQKTHLEQPQPNITPTNPNTHPSTTQKSNAGQPQSKGEPTQSTAEPNVSKKSKVGQQLKVEPTNPHTQPNASQTNVFIPNRSEFVLDPLAQELEQPNDLLLNSSPNMVLPDSLDLPQLAPEMQGELSSRGMGANINDNNGSDEDYNDNLGTAIKEKEQFSGLASSFAPSMPQLSNSGLSAPALVLKVQQEEDQPSSLSPNPFLSMPLLDDKSLAKLVAETEATEFEQFSGLAFSFAPSIPQLSNSGLPTPDLATKVQKFEKSASLSSSMLQPDANELKESNANSGGDEDYTANLGVAIEEKGELILSPNSTSTISQLASSELKKPTIDTKKSEEFKQSSSSKPNRERPVFKDLTNLKVLPKSAIAQTGLKKDTLDPKEEQQLKQATNLAPNSKPTTPQLDDSNAKECSKEVKKSKAGQQPKAESAQSATKPNVQQQSNSEWSVFKHLTNLSPNKKVQEFGQSSSLSTNSKPNILPLDAKNLKKDTLDPKAPELGQPIHLPLSNRSSVGARHLRVLRQKKVQKKETQPSTSPITADMIARVKIMIAEATTNGVDVFEINVLNFLANTLEKWYSGGVEINVNEQDTIGATALHYATALGDVEIVKAILSMEGVDVERVSDKYKITPLHIAAGLNKQEIVKLLIKAGAKSTAKDENGKTPLRYAIDEENKDIAELLLPTEANEEVKKYLTSLLHLTVESRNKEMVALLISSKSVDMKALDYHGYTILETAIDSGDVEIADLLINKGANVNESYFNAETPLHKAIRSNNQKMIELFIERGADVNAVDEDNQTPLHTALYYNDTNEKVIKLLIEKMTNVNAIDKDERTPLHLAARYGMEEVVKLLLANQANISAKNFHDKTPLDKATSHNNNGSHAGIIKLLNSKERQLKMKDRAESRIKNRTNRKS